MEQRADPPVIVWAKKHLNWVWWIAFAIRIAAIPVTVPTDSPIPYFVTTVLLIAVTLWVLHQKGRSLWWVLIAIATPFLSNKSVKE